MKGWSMNILAAEDDPVSAMSIQALLQRLGHTVAMASNGAEAWRQWQNGMTPIVILDWMMPEMDGLEVCRRIRASNPKEYTCIIMLTAKREKEDRIAALKAGVDVFLSKPLNKDELIARLQVAERILSMEHGSEHGDGYGVTRQAA